jgi:hypothetical protein
MISGVVQSLVNFPFLNMIGSCQFAAITTRCDIAYATNVVATSKRQGLPNTAQCNAVKRIGRYLKGTKHFKLVLGGLTGNGVLTAYTDADYGADHLDRKSRTGFVNFEILCLQEFLLHRLRLEVGDCLISSPCG